MGTLRVNGLDNKTKAEVMVTLYHFCVQGESEGLTIKELSRYSGASIKYLYDRIPVFARKAPYYVTGKLWNWPPLITRRAVERKAGAVYIYRLHEGGRHWCEDVLAREEFHAVEKRLQKRWGVKTDSWLSRLLPLNKKGDGTEGVTEGA